MIIALDAMGGDKGPLPLVKGAVLAAMQHGTEIILVGKKDILEEALSTVPSIEKLPITIEHASEVVGMAESPADALRRKKDSSVRVAFDLVRAGKAQGVVSAGNSGATLATAMFILGRIKGVRPAIATLIPTLREPALLIDVGANVDCKPHHLLQFGIMGSLFVREFLIKERPRVGLLSIGEEGRKGNTQVKKAYDLLDTSNLNFCGNVEGRDVFRGEVDVIVCDGFVGNICLKLSEGLAESVIAMLRNEIEGNLLATMGYGLAKKAFKRFKKRVDYAEYGGAPLLGVGGTAIICHGSSEPKAVMNAIGVAYNLASLKLAEKLEASMSNRKDVLRII